MSIRFLSIQKDKKNISGVSKSINYSDISEVKADVLHLKKELMETNTEIDALTTDIHSDSIEMQKLSSRKNKIIASLKDNLNILSVNKDYVATVGKIEKLSDEKDKFLEMKKKLDTDKENIDSMLRKLYSRKEITSNAGNIEKINSAVEKLKDNLEKENSYREKIKSVISENEGKNEELHEILEKIGLSVNENAYRNSRKLSNDLLEIRRYISGLQKKIDAGNKRLSELRKSDIGDRYQKEKKQLERLLNLTAVKKTTVLKNNPMNLLGADFVGTASQTVSDIAKSSIKSVSLSTLMNSSSTEINDIISKIGTSSSTASSSTASSTDTSLSVAESNSDTSTGTSINTAKWVYGNAPFDARLIRSDGFLSGGEIVPFASSNTSSVFSDMVEIAIDSSSDSGKHAGHLLPRDYKEAKRLSRNINLYGVQSIMNPYSAIRLYNGLSSVKQYNDKYLASDHRMLDIRDNRRFYDVNSRNGKGLTSTDGSADILSVTNPTVTNIIDIMCKDKWGRTPYSYQDFVFCKYFGRIPNNRLITLRKYMAPVYDNLCWEEMQMDEKKVTTSFAPIATMVTYFGGDSGNSLKDIFNITSGVKWGTVKSKIHEVTGDTGTPMGQVDESQMSNFGGLSYMPGFEGLNYISSNLTSLMKFFGMMRSPNAFNANAALVEKNTESLQDPNANGPYSNRIQGPLNRIDEVMKRDAGITFSNDITLKFSYIARPIGGMNTKAVMLDIISNVLLMCSATAVFWGGGYRFMIQPHGYPWNSVWGGKGILKKMYNGDILGSHGVIADWIGGLTHIAGASGENWWEKALSAFGNLGAAFLGTLGALADGLISTLTGEATQMAENLTGGIAGKADLSSYYFNKSKTDFANIISNSKSAWRANSVKETVLPYVGGMKALLIGTPVGNWHLTVGNPLNPIAVIGNLCCKDVQFQFGEELGPDDFPTELNCTVKLQHGMARDLASIESMFNRGAGRIYQIPDYTRMFGAQPTSDLETRVDNFTGGTAFRVPVNWTRFTGHATGYGTYSVSSGKTNQMQGSWNSNIALPVEKTEIVDYDYGKFSAKYSKDESSIHGYRSIFLGNMATRKLAEG